MSVRAMIARSLSLLSIALLAMSGLCYLAAVGWRISGWRADAFPAHWYEGLDADSWYLMMVYLYFLAVSFSVATFIVALVSLVVHRTRRAKALLLSSPAVFLFLIWSLLTLRG